MTMNFIITFHGIGLPTRALSNGEKKVWISKNTFVSILDMVLGDRSIKLTFDDGNSSDLSIAANELVKRNLSASFFITSSKIGKVGFLDNHQLRDLFSAGMEIGVHGMNHRPWRKLGQNDLKNELLHSKTAIEDIIQKKIDKCACPFGAYDSKVLTAIRQYGYRSVYTSDRLHATPSSWIKPRYSIHSWDTIQSLESYQKPKRHSIAYKTKELICYLKRIR